MNTPWKEPLELRGGGDSWDLYDADGRCVIRWNGFDSSDFPSTDVARAILKVLSVPVESSKEALKPFADFARRQDEKAKTDPRQKKIDEDFICSELHPAYNIGEKITMLDFRRAREVLDQLREVAAQ